MPLDLFQQGLKQVAEDTILFMPLWVRNFIEEAITSGTITHNLAYFELEHVSFDPIMGEWKVGKGKMANIDLPFSEAIIEDENKLPFQNESKLVYNLKFAEGNSRRLTNDEEALFFNYLKLLCKQIGVVDIDIRKKLLYAACLALYFRFGGYDLEQIVLMVDKAITEEVREYEDQELYENLIAELENPRSLFRISTYENYDLEQSYESTKSIAQQKAQTLVQICISYYFENTIDAKALVESMESIYSTFKKEVPDILNLVLLELERFKLPANLIQEIKQALLTLQASL